MQTVPLFYGMRAVGCFGVGEAEMPGAGAGAGAGAAIKKPPAKGGFDSVAIHIQRNALAPR
jgi:hypothetical protein